jgi:hypothetical protein
MIHSIPSGTRDVLPDETREVRAITDTLRAVFERHGYGEVYFASATSPTAIGACARSAVSRESCSRPGLS